MIDVEEHLAAVHAAVAPLEPQRLALAAARGLVLAEDVTARLAVPPFDNSAMDGFAVRSADLAGAGPETPVRLPVAADVPAGTDAAALPPGHTMRIMTGAPMPHGADSVVQVEMTDQPSGAAALPDVVAMHEQPAPGRHVRRGGEDITVGQHVLRAGVRLRAIHLSAAASVGYGQLLVHPRPRVGILATGDELRPAGATLAPGQIPDSNSELMVGLVAETGAQPVRLPPVGDDPARLEAVLAEHLGELDALVTSGGVSVGAFDVVKMALGSREAMTFHNVAMQPGKPQGFGVLEGGVPAFCLPGNPVSVLVSFELFVRPALLIMAGRPADGPPVAARASGAWRCPPGRRQYIPVVIDDAAPGSPPTVRAAAPGGSGSHLVASLAAAQGLAIVAADVDGVQAGDEVRLVDLRRR